MCVVMVIVMIESLGMLLALGEICDRHLDKEDLTRGLRVDGLGTVIGGILNTFPHSSFSQNVGLVGVTGVRSRLVTAVGGVILIILGLIPSQQFFGQLPHFLGPLSIVASSWRRSVRSRSTLISMALLRSRQVEFDPVHAAHGANSVSHH